jgi:hypothetical protein
MQFLGASKLSELTPGHVSRCLSQEFALYIIFHRWNESIGNLSKSQGCEANLVREYILFVTKTSPGINILKSSFIRIELFHYILKIFDRRVLHMS